ncbi:MAG: hypothetical protein E7320_06325 [Clostridiales bacterium]|nr:hypothetical protein [Clostridiales bacterium]
MRKERFARLCCALLSLVLCLKAFTPALAELDYTMGTKFFRQLWAGCGLMATMQVELSANEAAGGEALVTRQPFVIDLDYIYLEPDEKSAFKPHHRLNAVLKDGDAAASQLHMQLMEGVVSLNTPLLGEKWWSVPLADLLREAAQGQENTLAAQLTPAVQDALKTSGMPAMLQMLLPQLLRMQYQNDAVDALMSRIYLRTDLWIEGYRQDAALSRLEDGSPVVTVNYQVAPASIKAQAKQLVLELLSDEEALQALRAATDEETAALLLNPAFQPYYFAAIDQLPLTGDLTLSRTLDMQGETMALHLSLPFYDAQSGAVTLMYDRARGEGDLPDTNTLTVEGDGQGMSLSYLTYRSLTDVTVYQGTLHFTGGEAEPLPDIAFTLSSRSAQTKEAGDMNVHTLNWQLQLEPDPNGNAPEAFLPLQLKLDAAFSSRTPQTAATYLEALLTVSGDERPQTVALRLDGEIRPSWEPEAITGEQGELLTLTGTDLEDLLATLLTESSELVALLAQNTTVETTGDGQQAAAPAEDAAELENPADTPTEEPAGDAAEEPVGDTTEPEAPAGDTAEPEAPAEEPTGDTAEPETPAEEPTGDTAEPETPADTPAEEPTEDTAEPEAPADTPTEEPAEPEAP